MKRTISFLLALVMVFAMLPGQAFASGAEEGVPIEEPASAEGSAPVEEPASDRICEEGCEGSTGHEGECYGASMLAEETTYSVTFTAKNGNSTLRYVEIMIVDAAGNTVAYIETNARGTATYTLPAGTYTAIISYSSGNYAYYAEETFTVSGANMTVALNVTGEYSTSAAQSTYEKTSYFDHVDIRVKGTYTTGTTIDLTTYNIRLANVHIKVTNPDAYSRHNFDQTFTDNTETYEWRKTGVRVYKGASVTLTCDIYDSNTGDILKSGFTYTFYDGTHNGVDYGSTEFVKAIQQCDANQGLDFIIDPMEIIEAVYYDVSYQWTVVDEDTALAAELLKKLDQFATPPATTENYAPGSSHTIDTTWVEGTHFVVQADNGKYYRLHFEGWLEWSDEDTGKTPVGDQTALTITSDTIVYGEWIIEEMDDAKAYIKLTKAFAGDVALSDLTAEDLEGRWFTVTTPEIGSQGTAITDDVEFSQMTVENGKLVYYLPITVDGVYTVAEHGADIDGYTRTTAVTTTAIYDCDDTVVDGTVTDGGDGMIGGSFTADTTTVTDAAAAAIEIPASTTEALVAMGSFDFVNTYTKKVGDAIHNYPNLAVNKLDADDRSVLQGATFVLYKNYADGVFSDEVATGTSDESGYLYFRNLKPGTYYLVETSAPDGYLPGFAIYRVKVTQKEDYPKEILSDGVWSQYFEYDMSVEYSLDKGANWEASQHFSLGTTTNRFRLAAFNEKVSGQLTISKTFAGVDNDHYPASITVTVTYPDGSTTTHALSTSNNWTVTLTGLELGTYYLSEEIVQLPGYDFKGVTYNNGTSNKVTISVEDLIADYDVSDPVAAEKVVLNNTYEKVTETKHVYPSLTILKQRDSGHEVLSGATFKLYKDEALSELVAEGTTDANGALVFQNLSEGTYYLQETAAPNGYAENSTIYKVEVKESSRGDETYDESSSAHITVIYYDVTVENYRADDSFNADANQLTVKNTKDEGTLTIRKTFGVNNAYMPSEIKATVTGPNDYSKEVTLNQSNGWTVTLTGLALGEYTVSEPTTVTNVEGHPLYANDSVTSVSVTLSSGVSENGDDLSIGEAVLKNTYTKEVINPAAFEIKKVDSVTGAVITTGAEFTLYSDEKCETVVQTQTTDVHGIAYFYGFTEAKTYYLKETAAPAGYELGETVWKVTVKLKDGDPTVTVNPTTNIWETIYNWIIGSVNPDSEWADGVLTIENVKKTGMLTITKSVDDSEKYYANAEYSFTLTLSDRTEPVTFTLKDDGSKSIEDIPWGTTYTLTEDTTNAAFTSVITDSGNGKIWAAETAVTVTNTYKYTTHNNGLNLVKVDADDSTKVIAGAGFTLYSDKDCKTKVGEEVFSDANGKVELPITAADTYYLKETTTPTGYHPNNTVYTVTAEEKYVVKNAGTADAVTEIQMQIRIDELTGAASNEIDYTYNIKNTAIKTVVVTVEKVWDDGNYHARPDAVEVTLSRDGDAYETVTLNEDNDWSKTWDNLTDEYSWSVDEVNVPAEYTKSVTNDGGNWTITNTRTPKPVKITVTKAWNHNGGKDLPESINVTLYKDGVPYETVTLSEENDWTHIWDELTDVSVWSVDETEVPTGYTKEVTVDGYEFVITNTRIINPVEVSVTKVWVASEGVTHPESIEAVLYRDGVEYKTVKLSAKNDWSHTWTGLTDEYTWTVDEKEVPEGYSKNVTHDGTDFTITNTKNFKHIDVSVKKIWYGSGVTHPTSVKVTLYRNGEAYDTVALSASNGWSHTWSDLTDEFEWTVDEPSVPSGYNKSIRRDGYSFIITNTHEDNPKTGDFTNLFGLGTMAVIGAVGFGTTALMLIPRRKKEEDEQ